jgi:hypothetical protein
VFSQSRLKYIMPLQEANFIYKIYWKPLPGKTAFIIFGKLIITKKKWRYAATTNFNYTYSNTTKQALIWTQLLKLKPR